MNFNDPLPPDLSDCEELNAYLTRDTSPLVIPTPAEMGRMAHSELEALNESRSTWFDRDLTLKTGVVSGALLKVRVAMRSNRRSPIGRKGVIVSGEPTTGKTKAVAAVMQRMHAKFRQDCPDTWTTATPVAYVTVPPESTRRALMLRLADFYRVDAGKRASADELWLLVRNEMRVHRTILVVVDELQNLTVDRNGAISVDTLKDLSNSSAATFVYVGIRVSTTKLLAGTRGRQIAGRVTGVAALPYRNATDADRQSWHDLVEGFALALPLAANDPQLLVDQADWLYTSTHGYIGSLAWILSQAVDELVFADSPADETVTRELLEQMVLSEAARPEVRTGENPVELVL